MFYLDGDMLVSAWQFKAKWEKDHWWLLNAPPWLNGETVQFHKNKDGFLYAEVKKGETVTAIYPSEWLVLRQDGSLSKYSSAAFEQTFNEVKENK